MTLDIANMVETSAIWLIVDHLLLFNSFPRFRIYWRFLDTNTDDDTIRIVLEFEHPDEPASSNQRWSGFGWGSRMDNADAWIASGSDFSQL